MLNSGVQFSNTEIFTIFANTPENLQKLVILYNRSITKSTAQAILNANPHIVELYIMNKKRDVLAQRTLKNLADL